jgi:predicted membrane protein (TIGR00267 family)
MNEEESDEHTYALEGIAFGLTDGIICFLGLIVGLTKATSNPTLVVLGGIIGGIADAFGNSIGFYVSQATERKIQIHETREHGKTIHIHSSKEVLMSGVFTFIATIIVLFVMLFPFAILDVWNAVALAFVFGIVMAFVLGSYAGKIGGENAYKSGLKCACITLAAAMISYVVGEVLRTHLLYTI